MSGGVLKAQIWSLDFATSIVIFFLILIPLFFTFNYLNIQISGEREFGEIQKKALDISDALIRTSGIPENWNPGNVERLGLALEENVLNETKVNYFVSMDYGRLKELLGGKYDFFLKITDLNGTEYAERGSISQNKTAVPVERYCLYKDRIVRLELTLVE